ncbi:MAG: hypothetical protein K0U74_14810 [Alphaproteobacteria bacterium]|nr:hypothetical protein [Alphaproteobacteria bacterium]
MKLVSSLFKGVLICGGVLVATSVSSRAADSVDFSRYFSSSTALSAVSSALSILEPCDKPIKFSEKIEKEAVELTAVCKPDEGDSISVRLSFQRDESGNLFPDSFDYGD